MNEQKIYPEWLDADEDKLAEEICEIEAALPDCNEEFKQLHDERHKLLEEAPALRAVFAGDESTALSQENVVRLIRIIALDNRMREITDRAIFVYGRKNAYMFLRSIGMVL
jgi:hypothetical protein